MKIHEISTFILSGFTRAWTLGPSCPPMSTPGTVNIASVATPMETGNKYQYPNDI
jgi:hypothetical protein